MNTEESNIVSACCKHDQRACKKLYDTFAPKMFGVCLRYSKSRLDAQDVLHDGFVKVFENLSSLRHDDKLEPWILSIMINTALSRIRYNNLRMFKSLDSEEILEMPSECDYDRYDTQVLLDAIQSLPDNYRLVFNLFEIEGFSFEEISNKIGLSLSGTRSLYYRAKKRLHSYLGSREDF